MILPTKHVRPHHSLLAAGALVLLELDAPKTVSALWEQLRHAPPIGTFGRFVLSLDLLYLTGAVEFRGGLVRRAQ